VLLQTGAAYVSTYVKLYLIDSYQCYGETYFLHFTLKMEVIISSETWEGLTFYQNKRRHIQRTEIL
jgi:hypothetical protein